MMKKRKKSLQQLQKLLEGLTWSYFAVKRDSGPPSSKTIKGVKFWCVEGVFLGRYAIAVIARQQIIALKYLNITLDALDKPQPIKATNVMQCSLPEWEVATDIDEVKILLIIQGMEHEQIGAGTTGYAEGDHLG